MSTEHKKTVVLTAEEGASLSSGTLRLYAAATTRLSTPQSPLIVGCIDLYSYDPLNRRAAVGIMVANEHRRQGYALAMLHELQTMYSVRDGAQASTPLHQLYADIAAANAASLALFRKAGYAECGRFKEWLEYDSHFIDNIRMQLIL